MKKIATLNHWQASRGNTTLDRFGNIKKAHVGRIIRQTSVESNAVTEKETQIARMLELYRINPYGLTDEETKIKLNDYFDITIPNSTVSARRNDINTNHIRFCDANGLNSSHLIVSDSRRDNISGRSAMVWKLKQHCEVDLYE